MHTLALSARRMAGLSYIEVLVATFLIAVCLVPALEALAPGRAGAKIHAARVEDQYALVGRLEELLAQPFAALDTEAEAVGNAAVASTVYSDAAGTHNRRLVYLSRYDADNADGDNDLFTGTDDGLIWLRVEMAGTTLALEGLTSRYD